MVDSALFVVRPLEGKSETLDGAFRVHFHPEDLQALRLSVGDACLLRNQTGKEGVGIAWRSPTATTRRIVKVNHILKDAYEFVLGDKISISPQRSLSKAQEVWIRPLSSEIEKTNEDLYRFLAQIALYNLDGLWVGGHFDLTAKHQKSAKERFTIERIEGTKVHHTVTGPWSFHHDSIIHVSGASAHNVNGDNTRNVPNTGHESEVVDFTGVGGLNDQLDRLNNEIAYIRNLVQEEKSFCRYLHDDPPSRILLHGASGTGKSLVLSKLNSGPFRKVLRLGPLGARSSGKQDTHITQLFQEAIAFQPSALLIDNLDEIAAKGGETSAAVILCSEIDSLGSAAVTIIAAAQKPNEIDTKLRPYFDFEMELPIPTSEARLDILKSFRGQDSSTPSDDLLHEVALMTHGFVGRDLRQLSREADRAAWMRYQASSSCKTGVPELPNIPTPSTESKVPKSGIGVSLEDFVAALKRVRPTAMREVFFEVPKVSWSDIGGSESVKAALWRVVDLPFKHPDIMARSPYIPPRGILLYGPPGCSKTLTAKAIASSSGLNFISVKGAEVTSMYVGESERAVREIFRKAQAASPSVIFFDEVDAIASARDSGHGTPGLNIVTTLLTEMDGMQALREVLILAATNRPDVLDPALLRPGRFDTVLYVPPPPLSAREQILKINTRHPAFGQLDLNGLASRTEGFSGAEIVEICNHAVGVWTERQVTATRDTSNEASEEDKVSMADFEDALRKVHRTITPEILARFEEWAAQRVEVARL